MFVGEVIFYVVYLLFPAPDDVGLWSIHREACETPKWCQHISGNLEATLGTNGLKVGLLAYKPSPYETGL